MARKALSNPAGGAAEPSIARTPEGRLFAGIPNGVVGLAYYALVAACSLTRLPAAHDLALGASLVALATTLYLAYALVFRLRAACPLCWTAHAVNVALPFALWITR